MDLRSKSEIYAKALETLQLCPYVIVSLQHVVLKKKTHKVHMRYLASDVQADVLA